MAGTETCFAFTGNQHLEAVLKAEMLNICLEAIVCIYVSVCVCLGVCIRSNR